MSIHSALAAWFDNLCDSWTNSNGAEFLSSNSDDVDAAAQGISIVAEGAVDVTALYVNPVSSVAVAFGAVAINMSGGPTPCQCECGGGGCWAEALPGGYLCHMCSMVVVSPDGQHVCSCDCEGSGDPMSSAVSDGDHGVTPDWRGGGRRKGHSTADKVASIRGSAMPRIRQQMHHEGKLISWVDDFGDCLFMACAATICRDVNAHQLVRSRSVDEMEAHPEQYSPFMECDEGFGEHCVRMRKQFQWGGMVQLQAVSEASRRVIRVYRSNEPQHRQLYTDYSPQRSTPVGDCVEILYDYHGSHYWYIQRDMTSLVAQHYGRRSMSSALDA